MFSNANSVYVKVHLTGKLCTQQYPLHSMEHKYYVHNAFYHVHKSTKCILTGVVSSEQSPGKTIYDLKCKLTANVFVDMRKACCVLQ